MRLPVNYDIALTHIVSRKKQTVVVIIGITIGIGIFIFLNSLVRGFNRLSDETLFKSIPHLRIYQQDKISKPFLVTSDTTNTPVLVNPKIENLSKKLINPNNILSAIHNHPDVVAAAPWATVNLFYNNGSSQLSGIGSGVNIEQANAMFNIQSSMVEGDLNDLTNTSNGIIIGVGIAEQLNIRVNENITVISSIGIVKVMRVVGFTKTSNSVVDKSASYMNISSAQQLMGKGPDYVTDIYVNITDPKAALKYVNTFSQLTGYDVEAWQTANETAVASGKMRGIMMTAISLAILLVAAFGIYNILNMTIIEKINDIAILKATGFSGKDVVKIFVSEAVVIGSIGIVGGMLFATLLVNLVSRVYIGGDIGYFPIRFEPFVFVQGFIIGMLVTFGAGFIPARNAAKIDPVAIFRK